MPLRTHVFLKYNIPFLLYLLSVYIQNTTVNTFISNLADKTEELHPSMDIPDSLLKLSSAATAYDSVWALALAHHDLIKQDKTEFLLQDVDKALNHLSFNGIAVRFMKISSDINPLFTFCCFIFCFSSYIYSCCFSCEFFVSKGSSSFQAVISDFFGIAISFSLVYMTIIHLNCGIHTS